MDITDFIKHMTNLELEKIEETRAKKGIKMCTVDIRERAVYSSQKMHQIERLIDCKIITRVEAAGVCAVAIYYNVEGLKQWAIQH